MLSQSLYAVSRHLPRLIVRALIPVQEQLTAKSLALAVADERVAGMKKALELVSLALPPPPPPSHAYPTSSGQSSHPTTSLPPLLDDDRPNDDNHVNGIDMSPYMRIRKVEQQQQEEEDKIAALTRQKAQLGEDMLSLGRAHHHLNEDHAVLAKTHEVRGPQKSYQHILSTRVPSSYANILSTYLLGAECETL